MKPEINAAVGFLTRFLRVKGHVNDRQVQTFSQSLHDILAGKKKKTHFTHRITPRTVPNISLYRIWVIVGYILIKPGLFVWRKIAEEKLLCSLQVSLSALASAHTVCARLRGGGVKKKPTNVITQAKYSTFSQSKSQPRMDLITKTQFGDTLIG